MKKKLFDGSGIRGIVNLEITPTLVQRIGTALATIHKGGTAVIGRDTRTSSLMLEGALVAGLISAGADIYNLGLVPTPITAWMIKETGADTGIEITASHNPPQYNGLKIFNHRGMSLTVKEQLEIEYILENNVFLPNPWDSLGTIEMLDPIELYIDELMESIELSLDKKIACDLFNGATCTVAPLLLEEFAIHAEFINGIADGMFPAGNPEPSNESLQRLGKYMKSRNIPLGFGFDGDGDRMVPVDSTGQMVNLDSALAAYAAYEVEKNQGGIVVTHIGASMSVDDMVEEAGGEVVRTPVGDAFITETMAEQKAVFGGEPVGAWIHPDIHMCPDGLLSALKLIEALQETAMTIEDFIGQSPVYPIKRVKMKCPNNKKVEALEFISMNYLDTFNNVKSISNIDGVRFELEEGWILIRPSGTEPLIRITAEANTFQHVKEYSQKGISLVEKVLRELK